MGCFLLQDWYTSRQEFHESWYQHRLPLNVMCVRCRLRGNVSIKKLDHTPTLHPTNYIHNSIYSCVWLVVVWYWCILPIYFRVILLALGNCISEAPWWIWTHKSYGINTNDAIKTKLRTTYLGIFHGIYCNRSCVTECAGWNLKQNTQHAFKEIYLKMPHVQFQLSSWFLK